jgi:hypothetical protein
MNSFSATIIRVEIVNCGHDVDALYLYFRNTKGCFGSVERTICCILSLNELLFLSNTRLSFLASYLE